MKFTTDQINLFVDCGKFTIFDKYHIVVCPISIGPEGFFFDLQLIGEKIKLLQSDIDMYKSLIDLYDREYLVSYFKKCLEVSEKDLKTLTELEWKI